MTHCVKSCILFTLQAQIMALTASIKLKKPKISSWLISLRHLVVKFWTKSLIYLYRCHSHHPMAVMEAHFEPRRPGRGCSWPPELRTSLWLMEKANCWPTTGGRQRWRNPSPSSWEKRSEMNHRHDVRHWSRSTSKICVANRGCWHWLLGGLEFL